MPCPNCGGSKSLPVNCKHNFHKPRDLMAVLLKRIESELQQIDAYKRSYDGAPSAAVELCLSYRPSVDKPFRTCRIERTSYFSMERDTWGEPLYWVYFDDYETFILGRSILVPSSGLPQQ